MLYIPIYIYFNPVLRYYTLPTTYSNITFETSHLITDRYFQIEIISYNC